MIITFCGHSDFSQSDSLKEKTLTLLETLVGDKQVDFYLGGYGNFDAFAYSCTKEFKKKHPNSKLIFITPYIDEKYLESRKKDYDEIIFPEIESKIKRFAITYRNKWMVEKADHVIAYITREMGGAYYTYKHAISISKTPINLAYI